MSPETTSWDNTMVYVSCFFISWRYDATVPHFMYFKASAVESASQKNTWCSERWWNQICEVVKWRECILIRRMIHVHHYCSVLGFQVIPHSPQPMILHTVLLQCYPPFSKRKVPWGDLQVQAELPLELGRLHASGIMGLPAWGCRYTFLAFWSCAQRFCSCYSLRSLKWLLWWKCFTLIWTLIFD